MNIPTEVWGLIISHLPLNDLIQVSCVYRDFYRLSRTNSFYVKKLDETKKILGTDHGLFLPIETCMKRFTLLCSENYYLMLRLMTL